MQWFKENWFKVGVLAVITFSAAFAAYYFSLVVPHRSSTEVAQEQTTQNDLQYGLQNSNSTSLESSEVPNNTVPTNTQKNSNTKVKTQLVEFENYFEGIMLDSTLTVPSWLRIIIL